MTRGTTSVDNRRRLLPRDYLTDPDGFGQPRPVGRRLPPGGDRTSAVIAWLQHELVAAYHQRQPRPSGAALGRIFGFSRQTFSKSVLGQRWMGEAVQAAFVVTLTGHLAVLVQELAETTNRTV